MKYFKYILWTLLVIVPCIITILIYNDKIEKDSPIYYSQGVQFYNKGNYSDAFYNFSKIKTISTLYPISLLKQAKSAQKIGDYKTAILKYNFFLKKMPNSIFSTNARLNLAKCYYYLKYYDESKNEFAKLLKNKNDDSPEIIFFQGLIEKKFNKEKAAQYFRKYIELSINDETSSNMSYIISSADELFNLGIQLSDKDLKLIGIAYFNEHKYKEALDCFSKIPINDAWDYFVLSNYYFGNKVIAKKLIEEGIRTYSQIIEEKNLKEIYNIYISYFIGSRLNNWMQLEKLVNENKLKCHDYVLYKLAELSSKEKSIKYYMEIYKNYPQSRYAAESLWQIIWNSYKKNDYNVSEELSLEHLKTYPKVNLTPKVMFWLSKIYIKQNKFNNANNILNRLLLNYPDNYYGLRAKFILDRKNSFWQTSGFNRLPKKSSDIDFPISMSDLELKDLKLINTLFNFGDYEIWLDSDFSNPVVESWFDFKKGKKSRSIVTARDEIAKMETKAPLISSIYKLAYPLYFVPEINILGEKLDIDPFLIISIIREESYFNELAKSRTGAVGLMQLMPQTANYMLAKLKISEPVNIENARINLYIGSNYLKYLKDRFSNDLYVVAAYNGGEGSVQRWMKNFKSDDIDEFIEDIPFSETRDYVKKVFRTYQMYKQIYG